eukprot:gene15711-17297_t
MSSSSVEIQCLGDKIVRNVGEEVELKSQLTQTQKKLESSEKMNSLLLKKVKEQKEEIAKRGSIDETISSLKGDKKELISLAGQQKEIIEELFGRETHKIKKLRSDKVELASKVEAKNNDLARLSEENEALKRKILVEESINQENACRLEMAENEIKEKSKSIASKDEEMAVLLAENATLAASLKLRVEEVAAKDCKIEQLGTSFKEQADMLMQLEEENQKLESSSRVALAESATLAASLKLRVEEVAAKDCKIEQLGKSFEEQAAMLMQLEEENQKLESSSRVALAESATLAVSLKLRVEETAMNNCKIEQLEKSIEEQAAKLMQLEEEKKKLESSSREEVVRLFLEKMAATIALDVSSEENLRHKSRIEELQACIEDKQGKLREAIEEKCLLFKTNSGLNKILEGHNRVFDEIKKREEQIQQMRRSIKEENERILGRIEEVSNKAQIVAKNADNLKAKKKGKKILKIFRRRR